MSLPALSFHARAEFAEMSSWVGTHKLATPDEDLPAVDQVIMSWVQRRDIQRSATVKPQKIIAPPPQKKQRRSVSLNPLADWITKQKELEKHSLAKLELRRQGYYVPESDDESDAPDAADEQ